MLNLSDLPRIKVFRFPRSVIGYAVWLYHRFALSFRDVEDLLASRGIDVSYETVRDRVARAGNRQASFLSTHDQTAILFRPKRHRLSAKSYRHTRADAFELWREYTLELIE